MLRKRAFFVRCVSRTVLVHHTRIRQRRWTTTILGEPMIEQWRSRRYADIASYTHSELPPWFQEFAQSLFRDSMIDLVEALTLHRRPFERILDLGCGVGDWTVE